MIENLLNLPIAFPVENLLNLPIFPQSYSIPAGEGIKSELLTEHSYLVHPLNTAFVGRVHPAGPLWKRIPRKLKKKWRKKCLI